MLIIHVAQDSKPGEGSGGEADTEEIYYETAPGTPSELPTTLAGLVALVKEGEVSEHSLVWADGMEAWAKLGETPYWADHFAAARR